MNKSLFIFAAMVLMVGCQDSKHTQSLGPKVDADTASVVRINDVQIAAGARHEATLWPQHFDGDRVNSLGRQKLDAMLHADQSSEPLVIYLDVPDQAPRQASVKAYLKDRGFPENLVRFDQESETTFLANDQLKNMPRTDTGGAAGAEAAPAQGGAAAAASGLGSLLGALTK